MKNDKQLSFSAALAVCPQPTDVEVCPASEPELPLSIPKEAHQRIASILHDYSQTELSVSAIGTKHGLCAATVTHVAKAAGVELRGRGRTRLTECQQVVDSTEAWHSVISFRITTEEAHGVDQCRENQPALETASRSQAARTILLGCLNGKASRINVPFGNSRHLRLQPRKWGTGGNIVISFRLPQSNAHHLDEWLTQEPPSRAASRGQLARQILRDFLAGYQVEAEAPLEKAAPEPNQFLTEDDITGDIERLIAGLVSPYVDVSNPMLHFDELQAECRAKVARIMHDGVLSKCPTRAKVFAFIKTALKNHIRSLVLKHTFTLKRGGIGPRRAKSKAQNNGPVSEPKKVVVLRLDDGEACVQVGRQDIAPVLLEFFEEVEQALSPQEHAMLDYLLKRSTVDDEDDWPGSASLPSSLSVHGMTQAKFEKLRDRVRSVCSGILCP